MCIRDSGNVYKIYYQNVVHASGILYEYDPAATYSMTTGSDALILPTRVYTVDYFAYFVDVTMTEQGSGYLGQEPAVTFSAPPTGGTTATGIANVVGNKVMSIIVTDYGSGYTSVPTLTIAAPLTTGTTATAVVNSLKHIQVWRLLRNVGAGKTPKNNPFYWYREDVCGKLITSCKRRFQIKNSGATETYGYSTADGWTYNTAIALPFGGFPG